MYEDFSLLTLFPLLSSPSFLYLLFFNISLTPLQRRPKASFVDQCNESQCCKRHVEGIVLPLTFSSSLTNSSQYNQNLCCGHFSFTIQSQPPSPPSLLTYAPERALHPSPRWYPLSIPPSPPSLPLLFVFISLLSLTILYLNQQRYQGGIVLE